MHLSDLLQVLEALDQMYVLAEIHFSDLSKDQEHIIDFINLAVLSYILFWKSVINKLHSIFEKFHRPFLE